LEVFSLIFKDILLTIIALNILVFLIYDIISTMYTSKIISEKLLFVPPKIEERTVTGKTIEIELETMPKINLPAKISLNPPLPNSQTSPQAITPGETKIKLTFQPPLADIYKAEKANLTVTGPLKLTQMTVEAPLKITITAYPRTLAAIITALEFLTTTSPFTLGTGTAQLKIRGLGLEYMDTREYQPGDEPRTIDWKATARLAKLMIKEYYMERASTIHIIYDATAQDPVEKDQLATALINTALAAARQEIPTAITIHDQKQVKIHLKPAPPQQILKVALKYVLETMETPLETIYQLVEPVTQTKIKTILRHLDEEAEALKRFLEAELQAIRYAALKHPYTFLIKASYEMPEHTYHTIISSLNIDLVPFLEFVEKTKAKNHKITVIHPTKPWLHQKTLEQAYKTYKQQQKTLEIIKKHKVTTIKTK